jgi:hypothetical protein
MAKLTFASQPSIPLRKLRVISCYTLSRALALVFLRIQLLRAYPSSNRFFLDPRMQRSRSSAWRKLYRNTLQFAWLASGWYVEG